MAVFSYMEGIKTMTPLEKAAKELLKFGCFTKEASDITGYSSYHLLDMHKMNDKRISAVNIGRDVIFDRNSLNKIKKKITSRSSTPENATI